MNASMKAAVHLGIDHEEISSATRTPEFSEIRPSFSITQKEVIDQQNEIFGISTMDWDKIPWMRSILLHEGAIKVSDSKSVLLLRLGTLFQRQNCRVQNMCSLGRTELIGLHELLSIVSWTISMENQSCSRGRFYQGTPR